MTDTFDPEVIALLDEIARSPEGSLLKMPTRPLRHWVAAPEEIVSPRGSYLTRAEKHLVDVYREEAAWVLLERCVHKSRSVLFLHTTFHQNEKELVERSRSLREKLEGHEDALVEALERPEACSAAGLAAAAMRLMPCDFGRLCLGLGLMSQGDDASASSILGSLTTTRTLATTRAQAFENLGLLQARRGSFDAALEFDEIACALDESKIRLFVWGFSDAVQAGHPDIACRYLDGIEERRDPVTVTRIATEISHDRLLGKWKPTDSARRALPALTGRRTSTESERLIDAYC